MAGDWIKLEAVTPDKPEIYGVSERLGCSHGDAFLACVRLWIWVDQQSLKGNGIAVTKTSLDRIGGLERFSDALIDVGWLNEKNGRVTIPNFDRHNGKTAKDRALTAKRMAVHRSLNGYGSGVTSASPREEKRRDINTTPSGAFLKFWASWPSGQRKQARAKCWDLWQRKDYDQEATAILAHVEGMKRSPDWTRENGRFVPAPMVYLNQKRWDGADLSQITENVSPLYRREGVM
jgi:hypothetical protein